jgi:hypothetical protein
VLTRARGRWEYEIQERIRGLLRAVGFKVWWLSQYRRANQTPGLPDLLVMHPGLGIEATIEVKAPTGKLSVPQAEFAELRRRCGRVHLVGGLDVVEEYLCLQGLARREASGQLVLTPSQRAG